MTSEFELKGYFSQTYAPKYCCILLQVMNSCGLKETEPERGTNVSRKCEKFESVDCTRKALLPPCPHPMRTGGALPPLPPSSCVPD